MCAMIDGGVAPFVTREDQISSTGLPGELED